MTVKNPFQPATRVQKKAKVLVYGPAGSGKTVFALSFPGVAFVDMEGSADLYADHKSPLTGESLHFDVLRTKTLADVQRVIDFIRDDGGKTYQTLVIDPVTVLDLVLRGIGQKRAENRAVRYGRSTDEATMTDADWGAIKNKTYDLMTDLTNLPVNVVLTAHLKEEYETKRIEGREERVKVGVKPDAEKKTGYWAEFVFRMDVDKGKFVAFVDKQRGDYVKVGQRIDNLSYATLLPFIEAHAAGQVVTYQRESEAVSQDAKLLQETQPTGPDALAADYKRLYSKAVDLGVSLIKDGYTLPPAVPATSPKLPAMTEWLRNVVTQAEQMADTPDSVAA